METLIRSDEYERHEREGAHLSVESGMGHMARGVTSFMDGGASKQGREVGTWPLIDAAPEIRNAMHLCCECYFLPPGLVGPDSKLRLYFGEG